MLIYQRVTNEEYEEWLCLKWRIDPLVMTFTVCHGIDGPNRNRWFTVLKTGGSFHM